MNELHFYFFVKVYYTIRHEGIRNARMTGHVIRARSETDCLQIQRNYGISCPRFSNSIEKVSCRMISNNAEIIERRRKGMGGKVWYVKNGMLENE